MPIRNKTYYNVTLEGEGAGAEVIVPLTRISPGTPPDRDGNYLADLPALAPDAAGGARQRREITAIFVPHTGTVAPPVEDNFLALTHDPLETFYENDGFESPITITFNKDVNPTTAILGDTVLVTFPLSSANDISIEVIGNTIVIHNDTTGDVWAAGDISRVDIAFTAGLEAVDGDDLDNPGLFVFYDFVEA